MTTPVLHRPTGKLVAIAWVQRIPGVPLGKVGGTLPPEASWRGRGSADGFVTVTIVGGSKHPTAPIRMPVVQIDCYAAAAEQGSVRVPWGRASDLAEAIVAETDRYAEAGASGGVLVLPGKGYAPATVQTALALTEPREVPGDVAGYARLQFDVQLTWVSTLQEGTAP